MPEILHHRGDILLESVTKSWTFILSTFPFNRATNYELQNTNYEPLSFEPQTKLRTQSYILQTANHKRQPVTYELQTTNYKPIKLQAPDHKLQTTNCKQQTIYYELQTGNYDLQTTN